MTLSEWFRFIGVVLVVISLIGIVWIKWTRHSEGNPDKPVDWWA
jgi:hypothetical protein